MFCLRPALARVQTSIVAITLSLFLLGGCEHAKPVIFVEPQAAAKAYPLLVVADVQADPGVKIPADLLKHTKDRLITKFREAGFTVAAEKPSDPKQDFLLLDPKIHRYEAGSVLGRWLVGFGVGAATCALEVEITDGLSGAKAGDAAITETEQAGGLLSIGAEEYIVDRSVDSITKGISEKISKPKAGG